MRRSVDAILHTHNHSHKADEKKERFIGVWDFRPGNQLCTSTCPSGSRSLSLSLSLLIDWLITKTSRRTSSLLSSTIYISIALHCDYTQPNTEIYVCRKGSHFSY